MAGEHAFLLTLVYSLCQSWSACSGQNICSLSRLSKRGRAICWILSWSEPDEPGGGFGTLVYDTLRSADPADFASSGTCIESDGSGLTTIDNTSPAPGVLWAYLIRPENDCGQGTLGKATDGPRPPAVRCP